MGGGGAYLRNLTKILSKQLSMNVSKEEYISKYHKYLLSKEWREKRLNILNKRKRTCEACGSKKKLNVHHGTYARIFNEIEDDIFVLCEYCHLQYHTELLLSKTTVKKTKVFISRIKSKNKKAQKVVKVKINQSRSIEQLIERAGNYERNRKNKKKKKKTKLKS